MAHSADSTDKLAELCINAFSLADAALALAAMAVIVAITIIWKREFVSILLCPLRWVLTTGDPHATIDRLFNSKHVRDLQVIMAGVIMIFLAIIVYCALSRHDCSRFDQVNVLRNLITYLGPAIPIAGGILAWVYQIGSTRLGVVDLFACEICTLCKITTVFNGVGRRIEEYAKWMPAMNRAAGRAAAKRVTPFSSQEEYFPVFQTCAHDLEVLEAQVVINITAFYTYMKAARDALRQNAAIDAAKTKEHQLATRNLVYLLFLAMESARKAIKDLVEFQPEFAERSITILLSELEAYPFLTLQYPDENEMHRKRLELRRSEYELLVPKLYREVCRSHKKESDWEEARRLLSELEIKYFHATGCLLH